MESDADRLAMIKSLGGLSASIRGQSLFGIFDNGTIDVLDIVESRDPTFECRSSDAASIGIAKDDPIEFSDQQFRVKKLAPDGTGMTILALRK